MITVRFDPSDWQNDGQVYPPQVDNPRVVSGLNEFRRFRSKGHLTLNCDDGAIEIRTISGRLILSKPGKDGRTILKLGAAKK
jgi:hypothetical protein